MMKAVRFHEFGDPDVLRYEDVEQPVPGAGRGADPTSPRPRSTRVDANIRAGFMQGPIPVALPHTPGLDVAGTVDALGEGVDGLEVGRRVVGFLPMTADGASAEYVLAPAESCRGAHRASRSPTPPRCRWWRSPRGRRCSSTAR